LTRFESPAGKLHGRPARGHVHHAHVAPPHAASDAGAERLGAGLLGGKALGICFHTIFSAIGASALGVGEHPAEKAVAMPFDHLGDAADVGDIGAETENHGTLMLVHTAILARPRSIAARMAFTVWARPVNT